MVRFLLDTNALLDLVFCRYEDRHKAMLTAVRACTEDEHELFVPPHALNDMTYILENNAGMKAAMPSREERRACAAFVRETVFKFCELSPLDERVCWEAHRDRQEPDYEDALVAACARACEADAIVSSDARAFNAGPIRKLSPAEFEQFVCTARRSQP